MKTTLNAIRAHGPCEDGWQKLLKHLGKTKADDEPLAIRTVLKSNGLDDALWSLRAVEGFDREIRLFACDCAERVLPLFEAKFPDDNRPRHSIEVARRYAEGKATDNERAAAFDAGDAARVAAMVGGDTSWTAAAAASAWTAGDAARVAREAARDAALAAGDAAWNAGGTRAALAAELNWQTARFIQMLAATEPKL